MAWCEKHHRALFVIIHDKEFPVTKNLLYQVFSRYGKVEKIARFQTMGDFCAQVNFYSHRDVVIAFCKLQGRHIYEGCCELDLYFASEIICRCKPYIPRYMLDYRPPRAPLIPWRIPTNDYGVSSSRCYTRPRNCYLDGDHPAYSNTNYRRAFIKDDKEKIFEKESSKEEVELTKPHQVLDTNASCNVLSDNENRHLPWVDSQFYLDETLKKESSTLDLTDEAFLKEVDKDDVQANDEDVKVRTDLGRLPGETRVTQGAIAHVDFFIPQGFFEKIERHSMLHGYYHWRIFWVRLQEKFVPAKWGLGTSSKGKETEAGGGS